MDNQLTRRDFFVGLIATGLALGLSLPEGLSQEVTTVQFGKLMDDSSYLLQVLVFDKEHGHVETPEGWTRLD